MIVFITDPILIESIEKDCEKMKWKPDRVVEARLQEDLARHQRQPTADELLNGNAG